MNALVDMATLQQVLDYMRITGVDAVRDAWIESKITWLSELVEQYTQRQFGYRATITEKVRGYGAKRIRLKQKPAYRIAKINDVAVSVTDSDNMMSDYGLNGLVDRGCCNGLYTGCYIGTQTSRYVDTESRCEKFEYDGGYKMPNQTGVPSYVIPLPGGLTLAVIAAVAKLYSTTYQNMNFGGIQSESLMSHSVTYGMANENINYLVNPLGFFPLDSQIVINQYRTVGLW